jgi:hypothetical protein
MFQAFRNGILDAHDRGLGLAEAILFVLQVQGYWRRGRFHFFYGFFTISVKGIISNRRINEENLFGRGQQKLQFLLSESQVLSFLGASELLYRLLHFVQLFANIINIINPLEDYFVKNEPYKLVQNKPSNSTSRTDLQGAHSILQIDLFFKKRQ